MGFSINYYDKGCFYEIINNKRKFHIITFLLTGIMFKDRVECPFNSIMGNIKRKKNENYIPITCPSKSFNLLIGLQCHRHV